MEHKSGGAFHGYRNSPSPQSQKPILDLQQLAGNQAIQHLFRSGQIQAKLAISNPDDPEEREADHVADTIMRKAAGAPCSCSPGEEMCEECQQEQSTPTIQRRSSSPSAPAHVPRIVSDVLRSPGHPLDSASRAFFEPQFGRDFSDVRIHTDSHAAESARSISDIFLDYYLGSGTAGATHDNRYRCMLEMLGATIANGRVMQPIGAATSRLTTERPINQILPELTPIEGFQQVAMKFAAISMTFS